MKSFYKYCLFVCLFVCLLIVSTISTNCGLPKLEDFDDLNAPTGLEITELFELNEKNEVTIKIEFNCYNYEENFKGYNVYIVLDEEDDALYVDKLSTKAKEHIKELEINEDIENNYIIQDDNDDTNKDQPFPTIKAETIKNYYNGLESVDEDLANLYDKTNVCYEAGDPNKEMIFEIGDIIDDEVCTYKLRPFKYTYEITHLPSSETIDKSENYKIIVTAYDYEIPIESYASNEVLTSEYDG